MMEKSFSFLSLMFSGALFGFFYAWVCSTMWGLDATDPRVAIQAMQAMNGSIRNAVFAPVFFGTVVVLGIATAVQFAKGQRVAAGWFLAATITTLLFNNVMTFTILVPMNEALGMVVVPDSLDEAEAIWSAYSDPWKVRNYIRTAGCGLALALTAIGVLSERSTA